jgi:hypothetical protein
MHDVGGKAQNARLLEGSVQCPMVSSASCGTWTMEDARRFKVRAIQLMTTDLSEEFG